MSMAFVRGRTVGGACAVVVLSLMATTAGAAGPGPGELDPTWSADGQATVELGAESASDVAVAPDGRIVVVSRSGREVGVARLTAAGTLDQSFAGDGRRTLRLPGRAVSAEVAVDSRGRVVVAGSWLGSAASDVPEWLVFRLRSSGRMDATFSRDGERPILLGRGGSLGELTLLPDDRVLLGGSVVRRSGEVLPAIVRLQRNGGLDTSFGSGGVLVPDVVSPSRAVDLELMEDGRSVVALQVRGRPGLARVDSLGALDATFSGDGLARGDVPMEVRALALEADRFRVVGDSLPAGDVVTAAWIPNGSPDLLFGSRGVVVVDVDAQLLVADAVVDPNNGYGYVVGTIDSDRSDAFVLALSNVGDPLPGFGSGGVVELGGPRADRARAVALDQAGLLIVAGDLGVAGAPNDGSPVWVFRMFPGFA